MEKLMLLSVICLYIETLHNSVPRKRFIRHQIPRIDGLVPDKRFNRDKRYYFQDVEEMSLELHSNIKHQPDPSGTRLFIYNMLIINTKQTFSTTIRN